MLTIYREPGGAFVAAIAEREDGVADIGCDESATELRGAELRNAEKYLEARVSDCKVTWNKYQAWGPDDFYDDMVRVVAALPATRLHLWLEEAKRQCGDMVKIDAMNHALFGPDLPAVAIAYDTCDTRWQVRMPNRPTESVHTNVPVDSPVLYAAALLPLFEGVARVTRRLRWSDVCFALRDHEVDVLQNRSDHTDFAGICDRVSWDRKALLRARIAMGNDVHTAWTPVLL